VRRAYYSDNGEDALVLWCEGVDSPGYRDRLVALGVEVSPGRPGGVLVANTNDTGVAGSAGGDGHEDDSEVAP